MSELRLLTANDIDVRVGSKNKSKTKAQLLLYKDARVDMALLDEIYGAGNWQDDYKEIGGVLYCGIGVFINNQWVWKWSNGVESKGTGEDDTNNIKGEASDAFKRAGFMWGIGRELYNCKGIWIDLTKDEIDEIDDRGKVTKYGKAVYANVREVIFDEKTLMPKKLIIVDSNGKIRYELGKNVPSEEKPVETVNEHTTNIEPQNKEKVDSEPKNTLKPEDKQLEEDVKAKSKNVYKDLIELTFKELVKAEYPNPDPKSKDIVRSYFENTMKIPFSSFSKTVELSDNDEQKEPSIKGRLLLHKKEIWNGNSSDVPSLKKEVGTEISIYEMENGK